MYKLVISDDEGKTTVVPLLRDEVTIGREDGNTIRLTERNVSRKHARLSRANGTLKVEDLASYNGVKVNGEKIGAARVLSAGDQVTIGDYLIALQVDQADVASSATTATVSAPEGRDPATALIRTPESGPPARLVMLSEPAPGAEFAVTKDVLRIGRAEDLDAWVNHRSISREHAELTRGMNGYRLEDLNSANGIRVNGRDSRRSRVQNGDVIELGQVVFRFVGEGDPYVFDPSHTVAISNVDSSPPLPRAVLVLGIAVIALACGVAIYVALLPAGTPISFLGGRGARQGSPEELGEALDACEVSLEAGAFRQAVASAQRALSLHQTNNHAKRCLAAAERGLADKEVFDLGCDELADGNVDKALKAFLSLAPDSFFADRSEISDAKAAWAHQRLEAARDHLESDPQRAGELVREIIDSSFAPSALKNEASRMLDALAQPSGGEEDPPTEPAAAKAAPRQTRAARVARAATPAAEDPASDLSPVERCRQLHGFDSSFNTCVTQNVRPNTRTDLETLIEAHRSLNNQGAVCRLMREYLARFRTGRRSNSYMQIMNHQCRDAS